jgi:hypothetical protein
MRTLRRPALLLSLALLALVLPAAATRAALADPVPAPADPAPAEPPLGASLAQFFDPKFVAEVADPDGEMVEVNLPAGLVQGLAKGAATEDPAASKALSGLGGVNALVVTVKPDKVEEAQRRVRALSDELIAQGWSPMARVRDKTSTVTVLSGKPASGGKIDGLVVLVFDREERELVVCQIAGTFDLSQLGKITESLDVPGLDALDGSAQSP